MTRRRWNIHLPFIDSNLIGVARIASTDECRPALGGVLFVEEDGATKAIACDGYVLAMVQTDVKLTGLIPAKAFMPRTTSIEEKNKQVVAQRYNEPFQRVFDKLDAEGFPKYKSIMEPKERVQRIGLSRSVLESVIAMMKSSGQSIIEMDIPKEAVNPIKAKVGSIDMVIMPVRLREETK